ncbi:MAG: hypothetical protein KME35_11140 [Aphanocapsa sp. GSE-SYN-MK-11-07L]|nr:hypothetical protein [Aphanocapsa sp. GSE-SYN-MK-11-07L]
MLKPTALLLTLMALLDLLGQSALALPGQIVILRHGNKDMQNPADTNLDAAGLNRAIALPNILLKRYGKPATIFAPQPIPPNGNNIRSLQTITPTAIQAGVNINTQYTVGQEADLARFLLTDQTLNGKTVFVTWEHDHIPNLATALGIKNPEKWRGKDFDSIWRITFSGQQAQIAIESEGLGNQY